MLKKIFFIILIIFLILVVIFFWFFFEKKKTNENITIKESLKEFFPFGRPGETPGFQNNPTAENSTPGENTSVNTGSEDQKIPRLRHITTTPTAGAVIVERDKEELVGKIKKKIKEYFVRYIYRGNGHIEEIKTNSFDVTKISNTTIPKVYEAAFSPDGKNFIARFLGDNLDDIKTYSANLKPRVATTTDKKATSTQESIKTAEDEAHLEDVSGKYLDLNIREIAFSPSKNILSLFTSGDGGNIVLSDTKGDNKRTLYSGALREWLLSFPTESTAVVTTKPSGFAYGVSYKLNTANGALTKIVGELPGLTVLPSRDLLYILIGLGNDSVTTNIAKMDDPKNPSQVVNTIPEKCVWSKSNLDLVYCAVPKSIPRGTYPDDWYKGNVSFSDDIWKINLKTGFSSLVVSPQKEVGQEIDVINMDISTTDNYLVFINKKDLTLWGYDITDEVNKKPEPAPAPSTATTTVSTSTSSITATPTKK